VERGEITYNCFETTEFAGATPKFSSETPGEWKAFKQQFLEGSIGATAGGLAKFLMHFHTRNPICLVFVTLCYLHPPRHD
jgi:hypothetical protein